MATFRILYPEKVLFKGNFNDFKSYNDLKQKVIDKSQKKDQKLKENDVFILKFKNDNNLFIPGDLQEGIWNNQTFNYFKEKISLRKIIGNYTFQIEKLKKLPKWKKKDNNAYLQASLKDSWKNISNDIIKDLNSLKLEQGNAEYTKLKKQFEENEKKINKQKHNDIVCNNCYKKDFSGKRFICAECNNYNLCQDCEKLFYKKQIHEREHTLVQINKTPKDDLSKYNNIIGNNNQEFQNVPSSFSIEFSVVNSGDADLEKCYILPVRYGDKYLTCSPKIIEGSAQRNFIVKISLLARLPHSNKGCFEGYFRMFTPNGLPFGDVLFVKVQNGD